MILLELSQKACHESVTACQGGFPLLLDGLPLSLAARHNQSATRLHVPHGCCSVAANVCLLCLFI
jgi:hypothetical protein